MTSRSSARCIQPILDEATDAEEPDQLPGIVLPSLKRLLGAEGAVYHWIEPGRRYEEVHAFPDDLHAHICDPQSMSTYLHLMHQHPLLTHYANTDATGPMATSDLLSENQWRRRELYNEFFRPLQINDQIAILISRGPDWVMGVSVARNRRGFTPRDYELLGTLRRTLTIAHERVADRQEARQARSILTEFEIGRTRAAIVLDQRQRVGLTAGGLLDFLAHKTGPITKGQRLPEPLQRAFDRSVRSTGIKGIQLTWASPLQLILRCHRLTEPMTETLMLVERQTTEATLVDKLSTREREVLELRAEGLTTHAIASTLDLSGGTVRTFFQRAYTKLGVHSDAAAIDLLRRHQHKTIE